MIPEENVKDLQEIADNIKNKLEIVPVKWIDKVLEVALERQPSPLTEVDVAALPEVKPEVKDKAGDAKPGVITH